MAVPRRAKGGRARARVGRERRTEALGFCRFSMARCAKAKSAKAEKGSASSSSARCRTAVICAACFSRCAALAAV